MNTCKNPDQKTMNSGFSIDLQFLDRETYRLKEQINKTQG